MAQTIDPNLEKALCVGLVPACEHWGRTPSKLLCMSSFNIEGFIDLTTPPAILKHGLFGMKARDADGPLLLIVNGPLAQETLHRWRDQRRIRVRVVRDLDLVNDLHNASRIWRSIGTRVCIVQDPSLPAPPAGLLAWLNPADWFKHHGPQAKSRLEPSRKSPFTLDHAMYMVLRTYAELAGGPPVQTRTAYRIERPVEQPLVLHSPLLKEPLVIMCASIDGKKQLLFADDSLRQTIHDLHMQIGKCTVNGDVTISLQVPMGPGTRLPWSLTYKQAAVITEITSRPSTPTLHVVSNKPGSDRQGNGSSARALEVAR